MGTDQRRPLVDGLKRRMQWVRMHKDHGHGLSAGLGRILCGAALRAVRVR